MPDGSAGDQGSVIGVETGYMVNANSPNIDLAVEFLALLNSPANVQPFIEAEITPLAKSADGRDVDIDSAAGSSDAAQQRPATVLPPDTGYDLKMANALYAAEAAVLGGQQTPADALAALDAAAGPLASQAGRALPLGRPAASRPPDPSRDRREARPAHHPLAVPRARACSSSARRCCCRWC